MPAQFWIDNRDVEVPWGVRNGLLLRAEADPALADFLKRVKAAKASKTIVLKSIVEAEALYNLLDAWQKELKRKPPPGVRDLFNAVKDELHRRQQTGES